MDLPESLREIRSVIDLMRAHEASAPGDGSWASMRESFARLYRENIPLPAGVRFKEVSTPVAGVFGECDDFDDDLILLYCHGGGYCLGDAQSWAPLSGDLGRRLKMRSFSVEYRLAPEHPYPAANADVFLAYRWLLEVGYEARDIVIAGDSAGAALAFSVALQARDTGLPVPAAVVMLSPWIDLSLSRESIKTKASVDHVIQESALRLLGEAYMGGQALSTDLVSPIFANVEALPPTLIHTGSNEVMLDESVELARQLGLANVQVELEIWSHAFHGFHAWHDRLSLARDALDSVESFIKRVLASRVEKRRN
ncbi:monoterpene epsilon-lactone hydrolase [Paraburkholderia sp. GAS199]|uniref:alpha/beta hydrolase n=1 Tax=Paraburkholderia sp. GAS199 TaxID=3035126 RepID=UPI003D1EADD0